MNDSGQLHRFLAPEADQPGQTVMLDAAASRHLATVLRIRCGQLLRLFTGDGREFVGRVETANPAGCRVLVLEAVSGRPAPAGPATLGTRLVLGFAPPPTQRADLLVEKAAELGAAVLQPFTCERLQGYQGRQAAARRDRWERKAADAARQCGRADLAQVAEPVPFEHFIQAADEGLRLIACPEGAAPLWAALAGQPAAPASASLAVGPAGGFTRRETDAAAEAGFEAVSLGPNVLRVETAAICLLAGVVFWLDASARS